MSSENILQELEEKSSHSQMKENKRICHQQTYSKRMVKESSLNRKEIILKKRNFGALGRTNTESKN